MPHIMKTCLFKYIQNFTTKKKGGGGNFQIKNSDIFFHISAQNIDCGYSLEPPDQVGSNVHTQSMFLSRNKKNNVYPCKPQCYYIKVWFKWVKLYRYVFVMYTNTEWSRKAPSETDDLCFLQKLSEKNVFHHFTDTSLYIRKKTFFYDFTCT